MLLSRIRRMGRDSGSTIVPVIGLVAVAGILAALIASVSIQALSFTSLTRAGVQAQAAADAGLEFMRVQLRTNPCWGSNTLSRTYGEVYTGTAGAAELSRLGIDGAEPYFEAEVEYQGLLLGVLTGAWSTNCPLLPIGQVRITSTGFASAGGVGGVSGRDEHTVQALHRWVLGPAAPAINASGPTVYAYSSSGFGNGGNFYSVDGSVPSALIRTGNLSCTGDVQGLDFMVIEDGGASIGNSCNPTGDVWAEGRVTISGGVDVGGDIIADGVSLLSGAKVRGSVWSTEDVRLTGSSRIDGTLTAKSARFEGGQLHGNGWIYEDLVLTGNPDITAPMTAKSLSKPDWWNKTTFTIIPTGPGPSPYPTPVRPTVPDWVDFTYDSADWEGFTVRTTLLTCSASQLQTWMDAFPGPGVIDARLCLNGIVINGSTKVTLRDDVVIIANKFSLTNGGGFRADDDSRLWLITPDAGLLPNGVPNCPAGASFTLSGDFDFQDNIATMIYSPCAVSIGTGITTLRGQLYVGSASLSGAASIGFIPVGLPGQDLGTGEPSSGGGLLGLGAIGELIAYDDLGSSG